MSGMFGLPVHWSIVVYNGLANNIGRHQLNSILVHWFPYKLSASLSSLVRGLCMDGCTIYMAQALSIVYSSVPQVTPLFYSFCINEFHYV